MRFRARKFRKRKLTTDKNPKMFALIARIYESNDFTIEAAHKAFLAFGCHAVSQKQI